MSNADNAASVKCRSCGANVHWVRMIPSGKAMPVDAEPHSKGTISLNHSRTEAIVLPRKLREPGGPLYRSHFATCPEANQWRRQRDRR